MHKVYPEYHTVDITLAAVLKETGYSLDRITINNKKGTFVFLNVESEFIENFDKGNLLVEPVSFHNAIRTLTTAIKRQVNG